MMEDATHTIPFPAEVIGLILDQIEARDSLVLGDFANLARSCRALTGPALDRLWKVQGNLTPLIRCMPEDLWDQENIREDQLTFRRAIVETDWNRFEYYQWRVHQFGFTYDMSRTCLDTGDVHPNVLRALTTYRPAKVFLPNLRRWTANDSAQELLPFTDAFIGPKLRHVVMDLTGYPPAAELFIHISTPLLSLARLSANLQSLEFECNDDDDLYVLFFNLIMHLPNLRRLVISPTTICSEALDFLSRLPFLEVLSQVELRDGGVIPLFNTENGRFPSLKELSVDVLNHTITLPLLKVLQRPLQSVTLHISEHSAVDETIGLTYFKQVLSVLKQHHRFSLKKLDIYLPAIRTNPSRQATHDGFTPLYSLQSLRHLNLTTSSSIHLGDAWLVHAITFWPLLTLLKITHLGEGPGFTLKGLIPLIKACPQLSELSVRLNLKPVAISSLEGVSHPHIKCIYATHGSTLLRPRQVFRSLVAMFPNLTKLSWIGVYPHAALIDWGELIGLVENSWPVEEDEPQG